MTGELGELGELGLLGLLGLIRVFLLVGRRLTVDGRRLTVDGRQKTHRVERILGAQENPLRSLLHKEKSRRTEGFLCKTRGRPPQFANQKW